MVSNDSMSTVSKYSNCETRQQKIIIPLKNEWHVLVCSIFYTHATHLLGFDTIDMVLFDTKYFFVEATVCCLWAGLLRGFSILDCKFGPYGLLTQISLLNLGWALGHYRAV